MRSILLCEREKIMLLDTYLVMIYCVPIIL